MRRELKDVNLIFLFRFPLGVPVVDLTTERNAFGRSTAYSYHTFITTLDRVARTSVTNTEGAMCRPGKAVF